MTLIVGRRGESSCKGWITFRLFIKDRKHKMLVSYLKKTNSHPLSKQKQQNKTKKGCLRLPEITCDVISGNILGMVGHLYIAVKHLLEYAI